jgi:isoleucyl-tRNA synthetase
MNDPIKKQSKIAEREEQILKFWKDNKTFEKTLDKKNKKAFLDIVRSFFKKDEFVFYDGPPFATGMPHYGHILAGTIKDAIPRYKTMQGYHVPRKWGWDCHGLPVENLVEKELGLKSKKDIEIYGVAKFNAVAKESVMRYADLWRQIVPRLGRFVDMENDYRTMDSTYTESVWWAFKRLFSKKLIYQGFKSMHICPHCETTLSNFEVTQGYKDVADISVTAKFLIRDQRFKNTYLLAWTTTPWTLPGNVALAINSKIIYSKLKIDDPRYQGQEFIVAKPRIEAVLKEQKYEVLEEILGENLVGLSYEPIFDYYSSDKNIKNLENGWKVYAGDFVTTEDGTGVVHIAPAFGEDDYKLSVAKNLPFVQHVGMDGKFRQEVKDFAGLSVKPKENPETTDVEILKNLVGRGLLFTKEKINHPYPHCWRCDTPLLNYAASSWFVKVTDIKNKLVSENKKTGWVPPEIGEYRFGNWLSEARDWAISRTRFWGAPIPVWRCEKCGSVDVIGSVKELGLNKPPRNRYFVVRHGEAENNVRDIVSSSPDLPHHLTEKGKGQVEKAVLRLRGEKIDMIFYSPLVRTTETAKIIAEGLNLAPDLVKPDARLRETGKSAWDGKSVKEYHATIGEENYIGRFTSTAHNAESFNEIRERMNDFIKEIDGKYQGKNICVVTHDTPSWMLLTVSAGLEPKESVAMRGQADFFLQNAEVREMIYKEIGPRNELGELDLHRPYIDEINFSCQCGGVKKRVPEVFDCWFESGSMSYASAHYPFDKKVFDPRRFWSKRYPADFIAEGVDQTRGWFYSMLVLGVALFDRVPFKEVVVNGIILAEDGEKMSKRLKNYPDPVEIVDKYGADALRYYLLSSPAVKGEDIRFSEKGVDEVSKKVLTRLDNVLSFYTLYKDSVHLLPRGGESSNVLDVWIKARLGEITEQMTKALEKYELDKATRAIGEFVDDLSVWYLRRSRERFKGENDMDKRYALATLHFVLAEISKLIAPFMPFFGEHIFQSLQNTSYQPQSSQSVHLERWPTKLVDYIHHDILRDMKITREIVSKALELRASANIKVRQPLALLKLKVKDKKNKLKSELCQLIKDEVNVKNVQYDPELKDEMELNTVITPELREEGQIRELIRAVQEVRKNEGLTIKDFADLSFETDADGEKIIEKNRNLIMKTNLVKSISFATNLGSENVDLGGGIFVKIKLLK